MRGWCDLEVKVIGIRRSKPWEARVFDESLWMTCVSFLSLDRKKRDEGRTSNGAKVDPPFIPKCLRRWSKLVSTFSLNF